VILRAFNALLGLWLFVSGVVRHAMPGFHRVNAMVVGVLAVAFAVFGAQGFRRARYGNAALGGWLILSVVLTPWPGATVFWPHVIIGFLLALFGLTERASELRRA
jgi:hypothetical protein